jgi:hypothetical protein
MIIQWGAGQDFFGGNNDFAVASDTSVNDVIYYIGSEVIKNNRCTVSFGNVRIIKDRGANKFVDTKSVLNTRFDDYTYYESPGA